IPESVISISRSTTSPFTPADIAPFEVSQLPNRAIPFGEIKLTVKATVIEMLNSMASSLAICLYDSISSSYQILSA
ncbi:MAG: hypothetical protein JRF40_06130, partial [Deltaproteobacteria bacterium]|nr:hypothetical protein [Deltaproteobacteria bacterium]